MESDYETIARQQKELEQLRACVPEDIVVRQEGPERQIVLPDEMPPVVAVAADVLRSMVEEINEHRRREGDFLERVVSKLLSRSALLTKEGKQ